MGIEYKIDRRNSYIYFDDSDKLTAENIRKAREDYIRTFSKNPIYLHYLEGFKVRVAMLVYDETHPGDDLTDLKFEIQPGMTYQGLKLKEYNHESNYAAIACILSDKDI